MSRTLAGLALAVLALAPAGAAEPDAVFRELAAEAGQGRPLLRIGLEADHTLAVSARKGFRILDPDGRRAVWKDRFSGEIQVVAEGGPKEGVARVYRVQVGAYAVREAAERELARLESEIGERGVVRHDPDRGNWRVRLGRADDRLALAPVMEKLRERGLTAVWIAEEPAEELSGVKLRLVDDSYHSALAEATRLAVVPEGGGRIEINGRPYRGVFELRVTPFGTVRAINWIELEDYLLGVVPAELGPEVWPQLEALKAQAVAARTYVWRNLGQFDDEGFDLCATPRCQVYDGASVEHPLSDRAVRATAGQALFSGGEPIIALYTATCGGHTENGAEIFPEHDEPYLRGVPCRAEAEAMASLRATIDGRSIAPIEDETGAEVTREWALLQAAGVIAPDQADPAFAAGKLEGRTLRSWTTRLAALAGLAPPQGPVPEVASLGQAAAALLADLGWQERARVLLSEEDLPALLRDSAAAKLPADQQRALAYLAWVEGVRPDADGSYRVGRKPRAARMALPLAQIGRTYNAFGLREAVVSGMGKTSIRMIQGKGEIRLPLSDRPFLFGLSGGKPVPAKSLELWPGDRLRFRTNDQGKVDFLELLPPVKGASDDRSAAVYSWQVRKSRRQLEAAINRRVAVGRLEDLQIVRRGVSGRVVELRVVGSEGTAVVRGFDVRNLLDLREILAVIEIQRDDAGEIEAVVFAGKGWGHGVGLCQVGAYGMALRGADYRAILAHYYPGSRLGPIGEEGP